MVIVPTMASSAPDVHLCCDSLQHEFVNFQQSQFQEMCEAVAQHAMKAYWASGGIYVRII